MRNPERIPVVLDTIKKIWEANPDMRLGQLVNNISDEHTTDMFYIEDDELLERLRALYLKDASE